VNFKDEIQIFIASLEQRPDFTNDIALSRVVQLLKEVDSQIDLQHKKGLINRIAVDGIESWETINLISSFMTSYTKQQ